MSLILLNDKISKSEYSSISAGKMASVWHKRRRYLTVEIGDSDWNRTGVILSYVKKNQGVLCSRQLEFLIANNKLIRVLIINWQIAKSIFWDLWIFMVHFWKIELRSDRELMSPEHRDRTEDIITTVCLISFIFWVGDFQ